MTVPVATPNMEKTVTDYTDERMADLLKRAEDAERDLHLSKAQNDYKNRVLGVFARMMEVMGEDYDTSDWQRIMSACDTMTEDQIISLLVEYNVAEHSMFKREFIVTLTVPVTISVRVEAIDEDEATIS